MFRTRPVIILERPEVFKVEKNSINYSLMLRCGKMSAKLFINSDDFMPEKKYLLFPKRRKHSQRLYNLFYFYVADVYFV